MVQNQPRRLRVDLPGAGRPDPPPDMPSDEAEVWRSVVDSMPSGFFGGQTHGVLSLYCFHMAGVLNLVNQIRVIRGKLSRKPGDLEALAAMKHLSHLADRESNRVAALAQKLRITPMGDKVQRRHVQIPVEQAAGRSRPWED